MATIAYIALGSNQGGREAHLEEALAALGSLPGVTVVGTSPVYETDPVGGPAGQGKFLNSVAAVNTDLTAKQLLDELNKIEAAHGRPPQDEREYQGPRPLDLDILFFGDKIIGQAEPSSDPRSPIPDTRLTIPHPRMHRRWFVLKPLCDLAPDLVHPVLKRSASELLSDLSTEVTGSGL